MMFFQYLVVMTLEDAPSPVDDAQIVVDGFPLRVGCSRGNVAWAGLGGTKSAPSQ